jgi:hypothetical protein
MRWKWQLVALIVMCLGPFEIASGQSSPTLTSISPTSGPVGTTVTMEGTFLGGTMGTVTFFNSQTVTPTSWELDFTGRTTIIVAVPSLATTGNVVATPPGGPSSTPLLFTVTPTITSLSSSSGPVGQQVTITGNNFGSTQSGNSVTFNGTSAPVLLWGTGSITVIVPLGATTGNVVVKVGVYPSNGVSFTVAGTPLILAARTDMCETGNSFPIPQQLYSVSALGCNNSATTGQQGAALSYLGPFNSSGNPVAPPVSGSSSSGYNINGIASYLYGIGTAITDPDFGTVMYRATDYSLQNISGNYGGINCTGGDGSMQPSMGTSFSMGSGGGPGAWAIDDSKLLVINTDSVNQMLAFNPSTGQVAPTPICGSGITGSAGTAMSQVSPHIIYRLNADQENTVPFTGSISGTCVTPETVLQTATGATALLLAVNSSFVQMSSVTGSANNTAWTGQTSHCSFTPSNSYPAPIACGTASCYAVTIYKGTIADSGAPSTWSVSWSLLFNFNYISGMGAPYFPTGANTCMPANYDAGANGTGYTGQFGGSNDDSEFTVVLSDTGQVNGPGGTCHGSSSPNCTGPIYVVSYTASQGCRVLNSWTDTIVGDWGPGAPGPTQPVIGQETYITGTISGTFCGNYGGSCPAANETMTQASTGAWSQLNCTGNLVTVNGSSQQFQCAPVTTSGSVLMGVVYNNPSTGTPPDSTHEWCGGTSGACITPSPSMLPTNPPFYFPDVLHDQSQTPNPQVTSISWVQQGNANITNVAYNASTHQTTITTSGKAPIYSATSAGVVGAQQLQFYNLGGANDQYLNCTSLNNCPVWTVGVSSSGDTIVIADTQGGASNYNDPETTDCNSHGVPVYCPLFAPEGQGTNGGNASMNYGFQSNPNYWNPQTIVINTCTSPECQGHAAGGYINDYRAKQYTAFNITNPSVPCTTSGLPGGPVYGGPLSPCPSKPPQQYTLQLLPVTITDDQHGTYNDRGTTDLPPVAMSTTWVCGQASGAGSRPCEYSQNLGTGATNSCPNYPPPAQCVYVPYGYQSVWDNELIAIQNWITADWIIGAAGCEYNPPNDQNTGCVYRLGHTFATMNSWNFNAQNAIATMSNDGNWIAFPSDWYLTSGCMDGTTNCWDSWTATQSNASGAAISWSTDSSSPPIVTINMTNSLCPKSGYQWYGTGSYLACGSNPGTVTLSGFGESWLNQIYTLQTNVGTSPTNGGAWGCNTSTGVCNLFTATIPGATAVSCGGSVGPNQIPASCSGSETGTQKAEPVMNLPGGCNGLPCQRSDIWIANISTAHQ